MIRSAVAALAIALAGPAHAACDGLAWPLDRERALLNGPLEPVSSGETRSALPAGAIDLALQPAADVLLPVGSGKPPAPGTFAGYVILPVERGGDYVISLSREGWIDAVQGGVAIASTAHTGDPSCPGLRKSVRFPLEAKPLLLEIRNAPSDHIAVAITPAP